MATGMGFHTAVAQLSAAAWLSSAGIISALSEVSDHDRRTREISTPDTGK